MKIHSILPLITVALTVLTIAITIFVRRKSVSTLSVLVFLAGTMMTVIPEIFALHLREFDEIALWLRLGLTGELVGVFSILVFSYLYGRRDPLQEIKNATPFLILSIAGVLLCAYLLITQPPLVRLLLAPPAQVLLIGNPWLSAISFFVASMLFLAFFQMRKTYLAASGIDRWNLKYPLIGVGLWGFSVLIVHGGIIFNDGFERSIFYLEEVGLLFSDSFLLYAFLIQRPQDVALGMSRNALNRSVFLLLGGFGLVAMAGSANVLGTLGPVWGHLSLGLSLLLWIGAFVVVFSSERLRREMEEFLGVHFYSNRYDYRMAWMSLTRALAESRRPDELLPILMEQTREMTLSQTLTYGALDEESSVLTILDTLGWSPPRGKRRFEIPTSLLSSLSDGLPRHISLSPSGNPENYNADNSLSLLFKYLNASWILPLIFRKRLIGLLGIGLSQKSPDHFEERLLLQALSIQWTSLLIGASINREAAEKREIELLSGLRAFTFHDLKNAGSALRLLVHNAKKNMEDPEFREELLFCLDSVSKQMDQSMDQLLSPYNQDYSSLSEFSMGERVKSVVRALGWEDSPRLRLTVDLKEEALVLGNPLAFDTTLRNLLINAREILENRDGLGEIRVTLRDEGRFFSLLVSDNGPGMSREFIETRLFRPFQTTKKRGTGLGLFSCKILVEQSGGRIGVLSQEGEGTEFWLMYPKASEPSEHS